MDNRTILSKIPFVNFTLIEETLDEYYGDMERPFEVFPRWIAQSKILNDEGTRQSNAYVVAVDSKLERKIIVGHNFPNMVLEQGQMITTTDVLKLLGNKIGDLIEINVSISKIFTLPLRSIFFKSFRQTSSASSEQFSSKTTFRLTKVKRSYDSSTSASRLSSALKNS